MILLILIRLLLVSLLHTCSILRAFLCCKYGRIMPGSEFTLTLVRHGETRANKENVIQGQMDVHLSETGQLQAQLLADSLKHQRFTHVFCSDLARAHQTAQKVLEGNLHNRNVVISTDERLRERRFGIVEGKNFSELKNLAKEANQPVPHFTPQGAETVQEVRNRAILFFKELCETMTQEGAGHQESKRMRFNHENADSAPVASPGRADDEDKRAAEAKSKNIETLPSAPLDYKLNSKCIEALRNHEKTETPQLCVYVPTASNLRSLQKAQDLNAASIPLSTSARPQFFDSKGRPETIHLVKGSKDGDCPNVSLQPTGEIVHSTSESTDDTENQVSEGANVLLVSHGGLLKELIRYFVDDLSCSVPGGRVAALRISPNTGTSKFSISLADSPPKLYCLFVHEKDHLKGHPVVDKSAL